MEREITALTVQKRNKERINVYLDGQFAFGLAAIEAAHLRIGQTLDDEQITRLRERDEIERAYERALNYLSYRPRSKWEVGRNLRENGVDDSVIDAVTGRLTRADLLDDKEFARYWVDNRMRFNPRGLRGLRHELRQKGVSFSIIDETLATLDVEAAARQAAEVGTRRYSQAAPRDFRRKLHAYLVRRGFSYAVIRPLVQEKLEERRCKGGVEGEGEG